MATTSLGLSERQHALRSTGIGGSEIAAVAGLHPTRKPIDVFLEKTGAAEPFAGNEFTEWGQRIERVVAEAYRDRHPELDIFTPGTLRHRDPRFPFALATPDRVLVPTRRRAREVWQGLLEIKNVSTFRAGDFGDEDDEVPEHMLVQVQWQLEVGDLERATLVPLIGGHDYREYPIARDRETGGMLLEIAERFWRDHVLPGIPPAIDGSDSYAKFLRKRFPAEAGPLLEATPETAELVEALRQARAAEKAAKACAELAAQKVKALIGEAAGIAGLCTWKANKPSSKVEWEGVARNLAVRLGLSPTDFDVAVASQTVTTPGARQLRLAKEK